MRISFKKNRETGLAAIGSGWRSDVKIDGKRVGTISGGSWMGEESSARIAFVSDKKTVREKVKCFLKKIEPTLIYKFED